MILRWLRRLAHCHHYHLIGIASEHLCGASNKGLWHCCDCGHRKVHDADELYYTFWGNEYSKSLLRDESGELVR